MELQSVCDNLVDEVDGLVACMLLDLETGLALAYAGRPGFDAAAADRTARTASTMFRGKLVAQVAGSSSPPRPVAGYVREAQITTTNTYQFMTTSPGSPNALLILVTDKSLSIGLGWMAAHQAFDRLQQAEPEPTAAEPAEGWETAPAEAMPTATEATAAASRSPARAVPPVARSEGREPRSEQPRARTSPVRRGGERRAAETPRERRQRTPEPPRSTPVEPAAAAPAPEPAAPEPVVPERTAGSVRAGARASFGSKGKR